MTTHDDSHEADDIVQTLTETDETLLLHLRERLARSADIEGTLDVAYRTFDSPLGTLVLATTERGLVRIAFDRDGTDQVLSELSAKISPRILRAPAKLDGVARELDQYFAGARTTFDLPLDLQLASGFRRNVLSHLPEIPYGHTASYADIARWAGNPRAVRATGTACATNPLPIVIPCHRVIRTDGSLGNYAGGPAAKQQLIRLEATA
jgi:methylated-DNA-[protein]-cysteine S-methyltransferase